MRNKPEQRVLSKWIVQKTVHRLRKEVKDLDRLVVENNRYSKHSVQRNLGYFRLHQCPCETGQPRRKLLSYKIPSDRLATVYWIDAFDDGITEKRRRLPHKRVLS